MMALAWSRRLESTADLSQSEYSPGRRSVEDFNACSVPDIPGPPHGGLGGTAPLLGRPTEQRPFQTQDYPTWSRIALLRPMFCEAIVLRHSIASSLLARRA